MVKNKKICSSVFGLLVQRKRRVFHNIIRPSLRSSEHHKHHHKINKVNIINKEQEKYVTEAHGAFDSFFSNYCLFEQVITVQMEELLTHVVEECTVQAQTGYIVYRDLLVNLCLSEFQVSSKIFLFTRQRFIRKDG